MTTVNLNAYGVSEMNKQEMMETDGGWFGRIMYKPLADYLIWSLDQKDQPKNYA
jgi:hypothetical protein